MSSSRRSYKRGKHVRPKGEQQKLHQNQQLAQQSQQQAAQQQQAQPIRQSRPQQQASGQPQQSQQQPQRQTTRRPQQVNRQPAQQPYPRQAQGGAQPRQRAIPDGGRQSRPRDIPSVPHQPQQRMAPNSAYRPHSQSQQQPRQLQPRQQRELYTPVRKPYKAALVVLGILLTLVIATAAAIALYLNSLNSAMSLGDDAQEVEMALSDVKANEPFYVLVLGTDSRAGDAEQARQGAGQSDIMLLVRVDTSTNTITLVSIPRDTPYTEDDGTIVKINHEYDNGPAATVQAAEELTGVKISHYVDVSFADLEDFVDYLGGIEVDVPIELTVKDPLTDESITLESGRQTLNGQQALAFARDRHDYVNDQDVHRQKAVRQIVMAIMGKVRSQPVTELPATVKEMASCVDTDFKSTELMSLARQLTDGEITVYSVTGPYAGTTVENLDGQPWMCYLDPDGWKRLMDTVDAGNDPSGIDYVGDTVGIPGSDETLVLDEDSEMAPVGDEEEAEAEAKAEAESKGDQES